MKKELLNELTESVVTGPDLLEVVRVLNWNFRTVSPEGQALRRCLNNLLDQFEPKKKTPGQLISPMKQPTLTEYCTCGCDRPGADDHQQCKSLVTSGERIYRRHHV